MSRGRTPTSPSMTKEQLKSALIQHRIPLPPGSAKKEEFQRLYDERVLPSQSRALEFSSDDDEPEEVDEYDNSDVPPGSMEAIKNLTDEDLYAACVNVFGRDKVGPVVENTRVVYQNKLYSYFAPNEKKRSSSSPSHKGQMNGAAAAASPSAPSLLGTNGANGFSDSDDDTETASKASKASRESSRGTASRASRESASRASRESASKTSRETIHETSGPTHEIPYFQERPEYASTTTTATARRTKISYTNTTPSKKDDATFRERPGDVERASRASREASASGPTHEISYFRERPGYASTTSTATTRRTKMSYVTQSKEEDEEKIEDIHGSLPVQIMIFLALAIAAAVACYFYQDWLMALVTNRPGGETETDELDEYLESLKEG